MTHDILQSDIDLACRLRDEHRPDEEIIRALVRRGVHPDGAAQLLDDLHKGRKASIQSSLPPEYTLGRRSRPRRAARETSPRPSRRSPESESRRELSAQPTAPERKKPAVIWWVVAVLFVLAIVVAGSALFQRYPAGGNFRKAPTMKAPGAAAATTQTRSPAPPTLELQPDGLHVGGNLVTRDNVLSAVAHLLGVPTRTNQVGQAGGLVYAYDHLGLLIYTQPGAGTNSIVLDCEASGGAHGTTSPFVGTIKIEDQVIGPDTDAQTLAAIRQLGLGSPRTGGSVWGGRYHNLELVFAYLKSPRHLSLIEIDLK